MKSVELRTAQVPVVVYSERIGPAESMDAASRGSGVGVGDGAGELVPDGGADGDGELVAIATPLWVDDCVGRVSLEPVARLPSHRVETATATTTSAATATLGAVA